MIIDAARNARSPSTSSTLTSAGTARSATLPSSSRARIRTASIRVPPRARSTASVSGGAVPDETHQATPGRCQWRTRAATSSMISGTARPVLDRVT